MRKKFGEPLFSPTVTPSVFLAKKFCVVSASQVRCCASYAAAWPCFSWGRLFPSSAAGPMSHLLPGSQCAFLRRRIYANIVSCTPPPGAEPARKEKRSLVLTFSAPPILLSKKLKNKIYLSIHLSRGSGSSSAGQHLTRGARPPYVTRQELSIKLSMGCGPPRGRRLWAILWVTPGCLSCPQSYP